MKYKEVKSKTCPNCTKEFIYQKKSQKLCPTCVSNKISICTKHNHIHDTTKLCPQCLAEKSHIKFPEGSEYLECKICSYRSKELSGHIIKQHNITPEDYKKQYSIDKLKIQSLCDRVKGENNPGFNHGGKLSAFSKSFLKYNSEEDYHNGFENARTKSIQTKTEHPERDNTKIEYYLAQGYTHGESEELLSERQTTFSLNKCTERYGEAEGTKIWKERQDKWQDTLNNKSKEEIEEINRKKSASFSYKALWNDEYKKIKGIFYLIEIGEGLIKIGITSRTVKKRYGCHVQPEQIKFTLDGTMNSSFKLEQIIKNRLKDFRISKCEELIKFGWAEVFKTTPEFAISIINSISNIEQEFKEIFKRT